MIRRPVAARQRLAEALLWAAVVVCGLFVMIPAAAELLRSQELQAEEQEKDEIARRKAEESERILHWIVNDPQTDQRVPETEGRDLRNYRAQQEDPADEQ